MSAYVFVGPSLAAEEVRAAGDFVCLPPNIAVFQRSFRRTFVPMG